jgi:quinol monooxygenase YgiN
MTIRHLVMWTLKDPGQAGAFKAELDSCARLVPGMLQFHVVSRQDGLEANVDILLDSTFTDAAALAAYQSHPHHQAVSARLGPMRQSRHVMDYSL